MAEQPLPPRAELLIFGVRRRRRTNCLVDAETKTGSDTKLAGLLPGPMPLGLTWQVWSGAAMSCTASFVPIAQIAIETVRWQAVHEICGSRNMGKEVINQTLKSHI